MRAPKFANIASGIAVKGTDVWVVGTVWNGLTNGTRAVYWKNGSIHYLTDGLKSADAYDIAVVGE